MDKKSQKYTFKKALWFSIRKCGNVVNLFKQLHSYLILGFGSMRPKSFGAKFKSWGWSNSPIFPLHKLGMFITSSLSLLTTLGKNLCNIELWCIVHYLLIFLWLGNFYIKSPIRAKFRFFLIWKFYWLVWMGISNLLLVVNFRLTLQSVFACYVYFHDFQLSHRSSWW